MKTKILKTACDWTEVKNECRTTVNKEYTESEPTATFIHNILISEHSPIRLIKIKWRWDNIKYFISTHFARHWLGWDKFISTQRTDRTGIDREKLPQDAPVRMEIEANPQALINVSRVRLCNQASSETRKYMEDLKYTLYKNEETKEIANVMQKNCIYRCGCPEFMSCGYWEAFCKIHSDEDLLNIDNRYKLFNKDFYETMRKREENENENNK